MFGINKNKENDTLKELNMTTLMHSLGYQLGLLESTISRFSLTDGIEVYKTLKQSINILNKKFSIEELEGKREIKENYVITQEEFDKLVKENILPLIDYSKTAVLDWYGCPSQTPTSRIVLRNSNNEWLFDYNYDPENPHFYYSYDRVYTILTKHLSCEVYYSNKRMKSFVENQFNLHDVPLCNIKTI